MVVGEFRFLFGYLISYGGEVVERDEVVCGLFVNVVIVVVLILFVIMLLF